MGNKIKRILSHILCRFNLHIWKKKGIARTCRLCSKEQLNIREIWREKDGRLTLRDNWVKQY